MLKRIALTTLAWLGTMAVAAEPTTVNLAHTPIASPERIITGPAAMAVGTAGAIPIPSATLKFEAIGDAKDIIIAGQTVTITWNGENRFTLTTGGKTQNLKPIPNGYGMQPVDLKLEGGKSYAVAFPIAQIGESKGAKKAVIMYRAGAAQIGTIDGETVWVYDRNTDGTYEHENDSIRIGPAGKVSVFAPIYETFAAPKGIYVTSELAADGSSIKLAKYDGPIGKLEVTSPTASSDVYMILTSSDMKASAVVSGSSEKPPTIALPPGAYVVNYALVAAPATGRINAVILPASLSQVNIQADQTQRIELGGPLKLEYEVSIDSGKLKIDPSTIKVSGKSGEVYVQYHWSQRPEISVVTGATTKKLGRMPIGATAGLSEYSVPFTESGATKITLSGAIEGLGPVKGEANLK